MRSLECYFVIISLIAGNSGNKNQNSSLVCASTVLHSSAYIILQVSTVHAPVDRDDSIQISDPVCARVLTDCLINSGLQTAK